MDEQREDAANFRVHLKPNSFLIHKQNLQRKLSRFEEDYAKTIKGISERQKLLSRSLSSESEHSIPTSSVNTDVSTQSLVEVNYSVKPRRVSGGESMERERTKVQITERKNSILASKAWSFPAQTSFINEPREGACKLERRASLQRQKRVEKSEVPRKLSFNQRPLEKISVSELIRDKKDKQIISFMAKSQHELRDGESTESVEGSTMVESKERFDRYRLQDENRSEQRCLLKPINPLSGINTREKTLNNKVNILSVEDISRTVLERPLSIKTTHNSNNLLEPISVKGKRDLASEVQRRKDAIKERENAKGLSISLRQQVKSIDDSRERVESQYLSHYHRNEWSKEYNENGYLNEYPKNNPGKNENITGKQINIVDGNIISEGFSIKKGCLDPYGDEQRFLLNKSRNNVNKDGISSGDLEILSDKNGPKCVDKIFIERHGKNMQDIASVGGEKDKMRQNESESEPRNENEIAQNDDEIGQNKRENERCRNETEKNKSEMLRNKNKIRTNENEIKQNETEKISQCNENEIRKRIENEMEQSEVAKNEIEAKMERNEKEMEDDGLNRNKSEVKTEESPKKPCNQGYHVNTQKSRTLEVALIKEHKGKTGKPLKNNVGNDKQVRKFRKKRFTTGSRVSKREEKAPDEKVKSIYDNQVKSKQETHENKRKDNNSNATPLTSLKTIDNESTNKSKEDTDSANNVETLVSCEFLPEVSSSESFLTDLSLPKVLSPEMILTEVFTPESLSPHLLLPEEISTEVFSPEVLSQEITREKEPIFTWTNHSKEITTGNPYDETSQAANESSLKLSNQSRESQEADKIAAEKTELKAEKAEIIVETPEVKVEKPEVKVPNPEVRVGYPEVKAEKQEANQPISRGWRKLQAIPLAKLSQLNNKKPVKETEMLTDFQEKSSKGPGLLSFQQVVLAAIKREKEQKAQAERKKQQLFKERMSEIQQPTESFLRQTFDKAVHRGYTPSPPSSKGGGVARFRTVVRSLQGFHELGQTVSENRMNRAERIRKKSNVTLPYTRKLELLTQERKSVGEMMKDVEDCRYLRNKKQ